MADINLIVVDDSVLGQQLPLGVSGQLPVTGIVQKVSLGGGGAVPVTIQILTASTENGIDFGGSDQPCRGIQSGDVVHLGGRIQVQIEPASAPGAPRWLICDVPGVTAGGTSFGVCVFNTGTGGSFVGYCVCIFDAIQFVLLDPLGVVPLGFCDIIFEATYTAVPL